jgi:hypothetical protein
LRRISGPEKQQVPEELQNIHSSSNIIKVTKSKKIAHTEKLRNAYKLFVEKPERNQQLGIPRHRRKDNVKISLNEIGYRCMDWIQLDQNRAQWRDFMNTVMNLRFP